MKRRRRSMILVLVLLVIALLALAVGSFSRLMIAERRAADLSGRWVQARASADSGVDMARVFIVQENDIQEELGGWYDNAAQFCGQVLRDDLPGPDAARFTIVAPWIDYDGIATDKRYGLEDESSRLNLNAVMAFENQQPGLGRQLLMGLPGMTEDIADAILDWMDPDDEVREFGAEASEYRSYEPRYEPKNGPPESVEELMLVRGIRDNPRLLVGCDMDRNWWLDDGEPDQQSIEGVDNSDGSMNGGWASFLTIYSLESNIAPDGAEKIFLNQDDLQTLYDELTELFGEEVATFIVAYRIYEDADAAEEDQQTEQTEQTEQTDQNQQSQQTQDTQEEGSTSETATTEVEVPLSDMIGQLDLTQEAQRTITSVLDLIGARVALPAEEQAQTDTSTTGEDTSGDTTQQGQGGGQGAQTSGDTGETDAEGDASASGSDQTQQQQQEQRILECPFSDDPAAMDYLPDLLDYVTVIDSPVIIGRININQAPRRLLEAIPGMTPEIVDMIIAERLSDPIEAATMPGRRYETWILSEGLVTLEEMKTLMPFINAGGSVYRAQVIGFFDRGGPFMRIEVVLDATTKPDPARVVFWRDISNLGRGFTLEDLGANVQ